MMDAATKREVKTRLRRLAGQVEAIERMVAGDRYCVDVLNQVAAVQAALGKVGATVMRAHVETCVAEAMKHGSARARKRKIDELMAIYGRYAL
jgi:CsoR family transcriptional regulator, copper-sensing transcriptional repressor